MGPILITGGAGFVGRHVLVCLLKKGARDFWIIDDLSTGTSPEKWTLPAVVYEGTRDGMQIWHPVEWPEATIRFLHCDFAVFAQSELGIRPGLLDHKLPRFEQIYHYAAIVGGRMMIDHDPLKVALDLAIDSYFFLWAAKVNRPEHILYASSSAAYPVKHQHFEGAVALTEDMIDFGEDIGRPDMTYGWSKLTGEYLGRFAVQKYGLKVGAVRPFSGYGEDQDPSYPFPAIALRVAARHDPVKVWGSGEQGRDFVHIDDCAEICWRVCNEVHDGSAYSIGSGKLTSFLELARLMVEIEGYDAVVRGTNDDRPIGTPHRFCDPVITESRFNWKPSIPLRDGIARALATARERLANGVKPPDA